MLSPSLTSWICQHSGASSVSSTDTLQELWSGYGQLLRVHVDGADVPSIILKSIQVNGKGSHPRGWNTSRSHQRKLRSYQVEAHWYQTWSANVSDDTKLPACLALQELDGGMQLLLEDLDPLGFSLRRSTVSERELTACIHWLARFHARFVGATPSGLWPAGTYWHLDTRPDELEKLDDPDLKEAAPKIDALLREACFQTLVHGDAKLANFCFRPDGSEVAAVDFQYVGGGCGMKDLAYFLGSCLDEHQCETRETELLDLYFSAFREAYVGSDVVALEAEWRGLYPVAWTDFQRFLQGWCPGHWKINSYSKRLTRQVIERLRV